MTLVTGSQIGLHYGEIEIFSGLDMTITESARIGMIGPNGSGKTSLLKIIVGDLDQDNGSLNKAKDLRIGYVPQVSPLNSSGSLRDEIMGTFRELQDLEEAITVTSLELETDLPEARREIERRYSYLTERYEALGGYEYINKIDRVATGLGLSDQLLDTSMAASSGGERTRVALAKALLSDPDVLVLDEPTNYLDLKGLTWLERFLDRFPGAFIVVSHDRYFLDKVVTQIWELDYGKLQSFPGNYSKYRVLKTEQLRHQQKEYEKQQEYIIKEQYFIQRYHVGQRSREARGRATKLERLKRLDAPVRQASVGMVKIHASRTGQVVMHTKDLVVGFVIDSEPFDLISMPDVQIERGSRIAIIGDNGAGKTTLLKTLLGLASPLKGMIRLGNNVKVGYHRQGSEDLPDESSVLEALIDVKNVGIPDARSYLANFLFRGESVFRRVGSLSGGERSRLALARLLISEPNFLVLDEPTTHLDIPSREALEKVLSEFDGTLIFVSHDRHFISLFSDQLWVVNSGIIQHFRETFEEWVNSVETIDSKQSRLPKTRMRKSIVTSKKLPQPNLNAVSAEDIAELETVLKQLELQIQDASASRDVDAIARLGKEYTDTQLLLDQRLEEWIG